MPAASACAATRAAVSSSPSLQCVRAARTSGRAGPDREARRRQGLVQCREEVRGPAGEHAALHERAQQVQAQVRVARLHERLDGHVLGVSPVAQAVQGLG